MRKQISEPSISLKSARDRTTAPLALKPPTQRRNRLPHEQIPGDPITFVMILTRSLPICVFEPLGDVQAAAEECRYARQFLDRMCTTEDAAERLCLLAAFIVSGYSGMVGRRRKPFNPLLAETYDYISEDGWRYHGEQVSHHPPITACHAEGPGWQLFQALQGKVSFTLNSVSITSVLPVRLKLTNGDEYCWNKITTTIQNARAEASQRRVLNEGEMFIKSNTGFGARLCFVGDNENTVTGEVFRTDSPSTVLHQLAGSWSKGLNKIQPNKQIAKLFEPIPLSKHAVNYYGFSDFAMALNELHANETAFLPPTDSRYRPDQRHLENAEPKKAEQAKKQLELAQRKRVQLSHNPMWFRKELDPFTGEQLWRSTKLYWTAKEGQFQDDYSKQMLPIFEKHQ